METKQHYNNHFFFLFLAATTFVMFLFVKPFLTAIFAAALIAIFFKKPYEFLLKITGGRKEISSVLASIFVVLVASIPLLVVASLLAVEINDLYKEIVRENSVYQKYFFSAFEYAERVLPIDIINLEKVVNPKEAVGFLGGAMQNILLVIQGVFEGLIGFAVWILMMFFSLYYFFMDGEKIMSKVIAFGPLKEEHKRKFIDRFISVTRATLKGALIVGAIQGVLGGIIFLIAGISSPVTWGVAMFVASLVPMLGPFLVWAPAGIILILLGNIWQGIMILIFGVAVISTIDNLLRPRLVGKDTQMHPLLVFFSILGGIMVLGPVGFIVGPVVAAFFLSLWEIYGNGLDS